MTLNDVQRAQLALFAARAAGEGGSLEQMKAIAYCIRNRVKAGWWDGHWITVMEHAAESQGNHPSSFYLNPNDRALQRLIADIDEIYYGGWKFPGAPVVGETKIAPAQRFAAEGGDLEAAIGNCLYWAFLDRPFTPWFRTHILEQAHEHANRTQMGMMAFFE